MKLLVAVDGSGQALDAVRWALRLRGEGLAADFLLATVQEPTLLNEMILPPGSDWSRRSGAGVDRNGRTASVRRHRHGGERHLRKTKSRLPIHLLYLRIG